MTRNLTLRQIAMGLILIMAVSLVLSTPGVAVSVGASTTSTNLGGQPVGQVQSGVNTTQQNASNAGTTVVFENQTSNGSTVVIKRATLPKDGFIAIHTGAYTEAAASDSPASTVIAVSDHLSAGQHTNITVEISNAPQGNYPGLNRSRLNESQTLVAALYTDTNGNQRFDFVQTFGATDSLVTRNGSVVRDAARVRIPEPEPTTASVVFRNQTLRNNTLVVEEVRLPRGGFVVAHNASYRRTGDAVSSAVGISRYLPPGNYSNVPLRVLPGALNETQVVTIRPSLDTNDNQRYDYIRTGGFQDVAYEAVNRPGVVEDSALVRVPGAQQATTATPTSTPTPTRTTTTPSPPTAASRGAGESGDSDGWFGGLGIGVKLAIVALLAIGLILVARRLR